MFHEEEVHTNLHLLWNWFIQTNKNVSELVTFTTQTKAFFSSMIPVTPMRTSLVLGYLIVFIFSGSDFHCTKDDHCNNHGTCNLDNGRCNCDQDWDLQLDCSGM